MFFIIWYYCIDRQISSQRFVFYSRSIELICIILFISALLLDLLVVGILKGTVRRPRPVHNSNEDTMVTFKIDRVFSFPSGMCLTTHMYYVVSKELIY